LGVSDLLEDALRINSGSQARYELAIAREYAEMPPVSLEKQKVMQILVNLIRNAKQACAFAGPAGKILTLRIADDHGRVRIAVMDNGVGISAENLARIFVHGFTTKSDGHGFGLHSRANAAKEMGGSLHVHSDGPGKGATFTLELPYLATKISA